MRRIMADTMNTLELAEHRRKNGIVLLPVGCTEMHGVAVGISCDSFLAEAACRVLSEQWGAVIYPTIHYTYPGATSRGAGSVGVTPRETMDYIIAVVKAILRNGFKRLVLVSLHGPNDMVIRMCLREVFEQTGELPILFTPNYEGNEESFCARVMKEYGQPHNEAAAYLASLLICGRHGEFWPEYAGPDASGRTHPMESLRTLVKHGVGTPYYYKRPEDHVGTYPGLKISDAARLAEIYREVIVAQAQGLPEDYETYQAEMKAMVQSAPWDKHE